MTVFLNHRITDIFNKVSKLEWHPRNPIFAVAAQTPNDTGEVLVVSAETGKCIGFPISRPFMVTCIAWHPFDKILVIGWFTGCITVYYITDNNSVDLKYDTDSNLVSLIWSENGSRFLSADASGLINVWRQSNFGDILMKPSLSLSIDSKITCGILLKIDFKSSRETLNVSRETNQNEQTIMGLIKPKNFPIVADEITESSDSCNFVVGCTDGSIMRISADYLNSSESEDNHNNRVIRLANCEGNIIKMLCNSNKGIIIVLTENGMLHHYQLLPPLGEAAKEFTKMKLATNINCQPSLVWAEDTVLAMGLGETVVRLWDVEKADNYTLTPNLSNCENTNTIVKVIQVAYSREHRILAAGLNNGTVAFWQYGSEIEDTNDITNLVHSDPTLTQIQTEWADLDSDHKSTTTQFEYSCDNPTTLNHRIESNDEKGPESNWHPQPSAVLTSRTEEDFTTVSVDISRLVYLLSWDEKQECLGIAVSTRHSIENTEIAAGINSKYSVYLLQRQPLCCGFGGGRCAVVQTGPRSLAMLTVNRTQNQNFDTKQTNCNGESTNSGQRLSTSFIATTRTIISSTDPEQSDERTFFHSKQDNDRPTVLREHEAQVEDQIKALYCTQEHVAYWNGHRISVFKHATGDCIVHLSSFPCEFRFIGMYDQTVFTVEPFKLQVRNFQGTVKQLISFTEGEGSITLTAMCSTFMACLTNKNRLKIFDLSKREIKCVSSSKSLIDLVHSTVLIPNTKTQEKVVQTNTETLMTASVSSDELRISWLAVNRSGTAISFTVEMKLGGSVCKARWMQPMDSNEKSIHPITEAKLSDIKLNRNDRGDMNQIWIPDPKIYVYHLDKDQLQYFDFYVGSCDLISPNMNEDHQSNMNPFFTKSNRHATNLHSSDLIKYRWPNRHYWDQYDSRLLVVEAQELPDNHPGLDQLNCIKKDMDPINSLQIPNQDSDKRVRSTSRASSKLDSDTYEQVSRKFAKRRTMIVSLFISPDQNWLYVQEYFPMGKQHSALIGVEVPFLYFAVRCDLIYRIVNEQCQRRRDLATSNRRFISEPHSITPNNEPSMATNASGDRCTDEMSNSINRSMDIENSGLGKIHYINRRVMRDFVGLENADEMTREAMLSFSYFLAIGEMDAAFKAMKLIKSPAVWQNMARMCVNTCHLDMAKVCLGKMGNAMSSLMLREARSREPEIEAQAGELALQLGMPNEAERLFVQCKRWDLVIRLHQSLGNWNQALEICSNHNRILLRSTHYAYAKELEKAGQIQEAIEHYIKSETFRFEVPRMLKSSPQTLEKFVNSQSDRGIQRWWAQTLEAQGRLEEARNYYLQSKDYLSLVRVLCCLEQETTAEDLCNETGDPAACYHLARHLEAKGSIDQAIRLFTRAKAYSSAVRLCKEHDRNDHLFSLAQLGRPEDMLEAAKHLEQYPNYAGKAVLLFHKAGKISRAVELAFETKQFSALQTVAASLDENLDPALLRQCAEFFTQNNQFDRAVDILAAGKQYWEALKLCGDYNVPITEELAEKLTPPMGQTVDPERGSMLVELGELCQSQGLYHLACKKFTQAGSRIAAMKALLRSGDTEKIIFFANVSKQKEIYIMAANYLQTLDGWKSNVNTMRTIVQFYTRGRAPESLASFYEACAQAEIDDSTSYDKATGALSEAYKVLVKAMNSLSGDETSDLRIQKRLMQIKNRATLCKEFSEAQALFRTDADEAMRRCRMILENIEPSDIVRPGHVYAAMIKQLVTEEKFKAAHSCLEDLKECLGDPQAICRFLDRTTLESIHRGLNIPTPSDFTGQEPKERTTETADSPAWDDNVLEASMSEGTDEDY